MLIEPSHQGVQLLSYGPKVWKVTWMASELDSLQMGLLQSTEVGNGQRCTVGTPLTAT